MRQTILDGITYQIDSLNAIDQMELVRLGAPLGLQAISPILNRVGNFSSIEKAVESIGPETFVGVIERAAILDKAHWDNLRNLLLRLVTRKDSPSGVFVPLVHENVLLHEIKVPSLFKLLYESLQENLKDFGIALPTSSAPSVLENVASV